MTSREVEFEYAPEGWLRMVVIQARVDRGMLIERIARLNDQLEQLNSDITLAEAAIAKREAWH